MARQIELNPNAEVSGHAQNPSSVLCTNSLQPRGFHRLQTDYCEAMIMVDNPDFNPGKPETPGHPEDPGKPANPKKLKIICPCTKYEAPVEEPKPGPPPQIKGPKDDDVHSGNSGNNVGQSITITDSSNNPSEVPPATEGQQPFPT